MLVLFLAAYAYYGLLRPAIAVRVVIYDLTTALFSIGTAMTFLTSPPAGKRKRMDFAAALPMILDALTKIILIGLQTFKFHDRGAFPSK